VNLCFGSSKTPTPQAIPPTPPAPAPYATTQPADVTAASLAEKKRKQLAAVKYGMASTIKTEEDSGASNLMMPALMGGGLKTKLGS